jgi:hypothetical protein
MMKSPGRRVPQELVESVAGTLQGLVKEYYHRWNLTPRAHLDIRKN